MIAQTQHEKQAVSWHREKGRFRQGQSEIPQGRSCIPSGALLYFLKGSQFAAYSAAGAGLTSADVSAVS